MMMGMIITKAAAALLVGVILDFRAFAADLYVATNGSDAATNPGTSISSPLLTMQRAITLAKPGDTIYVRAGSYGRAHFGTKSGTAGAPITLRNYPGEKPKIQDVYIGRFGTTDKVGWVTVKGFDISYGLEFHNANDLVISDNYIHDRPGQGIIGNGIRIRIERNIVARNGRFAECAANHATCNQDHGMYLTGTDFTITNNVVYGNMAYGIQVAGYPYDCTLYYNGQYCSSWSYAGPEYAGASGFKIYNNTIAFQRYAAAIVVWQKWAVNNTITNNILYRNAEDPKSTDTHGISFYFSGAGNVVANNIYYGPFSVLKDNIRDNRGGSYTETGAKTADPQFKNPSAFDFHLTSNSPALNWGLNLYSAGVTTDIELAPRPQSGPFDVGAYEFASNSGPLANASPAKVRGLRWR